ncbi:MAG: hypothetical protein IPJ68_05575 [Candidatus Moraniibacteriota bacterium]|nr:MAG: hypothetical protein IPJ68_05575 [Candidatus Moranbacteria bacterium]
MEKIVDKITSYNLFNYLFPGVLFSIALEHLTPYSLTYENLIIAAFVYYFVGLIVSRFASLIVEPLLRWTRFIKFAEYDDFIIAAKEDPKIDVLLETNNMYRTFVSAIVLLVAARGYELLSYKVPFLGDYKWWILIASLLVIFLISYRKQTSYIKRRVESIKS